MLGHSAQALPFAILFLSSSPNLCPRLLSRPTLALASLFPSLACLASVCSVALRWRFRLRSRSCQLCLVSVYSAVLRWSCLLRSCDCTCTALASLNLISEFREHAILEENIYGMWPRTNVQTHKHFNADALVWGSLMLAPINIARTTSEMQGIVGRA